MRNYKGDGNLIALTTPAAIATGAGLLVGGFFGITCKPAGAGEVVECLRAGEFTVAKNSAEAWAVGDTIYWDDTAKLFTAVVASNKQVGFAAAVAANPSATGIVQLVPMAGNVARFGFTGGNVTGLVGPDGSTFQTTRVWSSGLPFVLVASGNITSVAGQVTTGTAHDYVIGPSYTFFPASALYSASPAGWYYTNWTSATVGKVYANTYINGNPQIPASPTALTTVIGAYTQTTAFDVVGPNVVVPANSIGPNGVLEWQRFANNNNSAGNKIYNTYFGGTFFQGVTQSTNPKEAGAGSLKNRGRTSAQVGANASHGDNNNVSAFTKLSIDTTAQQVASMTLQLAVATDYAIIESFLFRVTYSA